MSLVYDAVIQLTDNNQQQENNMSNVQPWSVNDDVSVDTSPIGIKVKARCTSVPKASKAFGPTVEWVANQYNKGVPMARCLGVFTTRLANKPNALKKKEVAEVLSCIALTYEFYPMGRPQRMATK